MKLELKDITDIHKNIPAVITAHGPSLNLCKDKITEAHKNKKVLRFSVNNWWDYFQTVPDYWILSSTEFTIERLFSIINTHNITTFYSDDGDFTPKDFIEKNIKADWLVYDQNVAMRTLLLEQRYKNILEIFLIAINITVPVTQLLCML
jgi:hypothetical protein